MADINLNIVGSADFSQINGAVRRLQAQLAQLQAQYNTTGSAQLFKGIKTAVNDFNDYAEASGKFRVHTVNATSAAEQLGERIRRNSLTLSDYRMAWARLNKEGSYYLELGKKQIAMQEAQAVTVGKTTHVYENLALNFKNTALAARANAAAVAAQNAALKELSVGMVNWGKNMQWSGRQITMGLVMPLVMFGAQSAKIFNEVDKNLTRLAKVYGVGLTEPTQKALKSIRKDVLDLSNELGKSLGIASNEVTDIAAQFAAAGMQGRELLNATKQASRMVVLGEADKQEAINATISLQTAYKLSTTEVTEAVNFFNAAQAATSTSMGDLIQAIPRVGPIIKNLGGSYKDMVAILTALKEGGVPAGEAANAIKNSLTRIITPTEAAKKTLKSFGIDLEKIVARNVGNLSGTLTELQTGLSGLDSISKQSAITQLFGRYQSARMTAFVENFNKAGSQSAKITEMMGISATKLADIADKQTKKIQQSASGRFKIAVESMKNSLLPLGQMFLDTFTWAIKMITKLSETLQDLPSPIKTVIKMLAGFTALAGPIIMITGVLANFLGLIGRGLIGIKKFVGGIRNMFSGGGIEGFKTIWSGFKDVDLVADAATRSVQLFNDQSKNTVSAAQVFENGIDKMIISLQALSQQAMNTRGALDTVIAPSAVSTTRIPNAAKESLINDAQIVGQNPYLLAQFSNSKLSKGLSYHHYGSEESYAGGKIPGNWLTSRMFPEFTRSVNSGMNKDAAFIYGSVQQQQIVKDMIARTVSKLPGPAEIARNQISQEIIPRSIQSESLARARDLAFLQSMAESPEHQQKMVAAQIRSIDKNTTLGSVEQAQLVKGIVDKQLLTFKNYESFVAKESEELTKVFEGALSKLSANSTPEQIKAALVEANTAFGSLLSKKEKEIRESALLFEDFKLKTANKSGPRMALIQLSHSVMEWQSWLTSEISQQVKEIEIFKTDGRRRANGIISELKAQNRIFTDELINGQRYLIEATRGVENAVIIKISNDGRQLNMTADELASLKANPEYMAALSRIEPEILKLEEKIGVRIMGDLALMNSAGTLETSGPNMTAMANANLLRQKRLDLIKEKEAQTSTNVAEAKQLRNQKFAGKVGAVGMMTSMGLMTAGVGNETVNAGVMGLSMASMLPMLSSFAGLAIGPQAAIFAAVAAIPLLIKGIGVLIDKASVLNRAMDGAFKVSALEAEHFNLKINEIGQMSLPRVGKEAKKTADEVDALVSRIRSLGSEDPLKVLVDSLKDMSVGQQLQMLQSKYLTLRIQGVDDKEIRTFIQSIMRAAGIEMNVGFQMNPFYDKASQQSTSKLIKEQADAMIKTIESSTSWLDANNATSTYLEQLSTGSLGFLTIGPAADAARKSVSDFAQTLNDVMMNTPPDKLGKLLDDIKEKTKGNTDVTNLYKASLRELFMQSGAVGEQYWGLLEKSSMSLENRFKFLSLALNGFVKNYDDAVLLSQDPIEVKIRFRYMQRTKSISEAISGLDSNLAKNATSTTFTVQDAAITKTQTQVDKQQSLVDKLQEELNKRNAILDAQKKSLEYSSSQASLQQQYNEAVATNDLAKAADIQRQMTSNQADYNAELERSSLQGRLDKESGKLGKLNDNLSKSQKLAQNTVEELSTYTEKAMGLVYKALADGTKVSKEDLSKIAKEIHDKFGVPVEVTKDLITKTFNELDANKVVDFGVAAANAFDKNWIPKQKESAILATYIQNVSNGMDQEKAMSNAISSITGNKVRAVTGKDGKVRYEMAVPGSGAGVRAEERWVGVSTSGVLSEGSPTYSGGDGKIPPTSFKYGTYNPGDKYTTTDGKEYFYTQETRKKGYWLSPIGDPAIEVKTFAEGGFVRGYKERGYVSGPGTGTSDSILARLSNGEFVMKANAVKAIGIDTLNAMNNSVPTYANGGYVRGYKGGGFIGGGANTPGVGGLNTDLIAYRRILASNPELARQMAKREDYAVANYLYAMSKDKDYQRSLDKQSTQDYSEWLNTRRTAYKNQYEGWTPTFGKISKTPFNMSYRAYQKNKAYKQMFSAMGEMGFSGVASSMLQQFLSNPLYMTAEMTGLAGLYRAGKEKLGFRSYDDSAEGDIEREMDYLGALVSLIPGVGVGGSAIKGGAKGFQLGLRGSSLLSHTVKSGYNTMLTKSVVDLAKFTGRKGLGAVDALKLGARQAYDVTGRTSNPRDIFKNRFTQSSGRDIESQKGLINKALFNSSFLASAVPGRFKRYFTLAGNLDFMPIPRNLRDTLSSVYFKEIYDDGKTILDSNKFMSMSPQEQALYITRMIVTRSQKNLDQPHQLSHPLEVPEDTGRTRGPGTYFGLSSLESTGMYGGFGSDMFRVSMSQGTVKDILSSSGYIMGTDHLNKLIEEYTQIPGNKGMRFESGSAGRVSGGIRDFDWDHPFIRWLDQTKGYLGYVHGEDLTAATNWRVGASKNMDDWTLDRTYGLMSAARRLKLKNTSLFKYLPQIYKTLNPNKNILNQIKNAFTVEPYRNLKHDLGRAFFMNKEHRQIMPTSKIGRAVRNFTSGDLARYIKSNFSFTGDMRDMLVTLSDEKLAPSIALDSRVVSQGTPNLASKNYRNALNPVALYKFLTSKGFANQLGVSRTGKDIIYGTALRDPEVVEALRALYVEPASKNPLFEWNNELEKLTAYLKPEQALDILEKSGYYGTTMGGRAQRQFISTLGSRATAPRFVIDLLKEGKIGRDAKIPNSIIRRMLMGTIYKDRRFPWQAKPFTPTGILSAEQRAKLTATAKPGMLDLTKNMFTNLGSSAKNMFTGTASGLGNIFKFIKENGVGGAFNIGIKNLRSEINSKIRLGREISAIDKAFRNGNLDVDFHRIMRDGTIDESRDEFTRGLNVHLPPGYDSMKYIKSNGNGGWKYDVESAMADFGTTRPGVYDKDSYLSKNYRIFGNEEEYGDFARLVLSKSADDLSDPDIMDQIMMTKFGHEWKYYYQMFNNNINPENLQLFARAVLGDAPPKPLSEGELAELMRIQETGSKLTSSKYGTLLVDKVVDPLSNLTRYFKKTVPGNLKREKNKLTAKFKNLALKTRFHITEPFNPLLFSEKIFPNMGKDIDPRIRALQIIRHGVHRSESPIIGTKSFNDIEMEKGIVNGVTRGPGSYFTTQALGQLSSMYNWFGKNIYRLKQSPELVDEIMNSSGFIYGREHLNQLIEEFNTLTGRDLLEGEIPGRPTEGIARTVPDKVKYGIESGSALHVKGGLRDLSINDPLIQWLMNDKKFLGYQHGKWNQAVTMWKMGMGETATGGPRWEMEGIPSIKAAIQESIKNRKTIPGMVLPRNTDWALKGRELEGFRPGATAETVPVTIGGENAFLKTSKNLDLYAANHPSVSLRQSLSEVIGSRIFRELGLNAPVNTIFRQPGKLSVLSRELPGFIQAKNVSLEDVVSRIEYFKYITAQEFIGDSDGLFGNMGMVNSGNVMFNPDTSQLARIDLGLSIGTKYSSLSDIIKNRLANTGLFPFEDTTQVPYAPIEFTPKRFQSVSEAEDLLNFLLKARELDVSRILNNEDVLPRWVKSLKDDVYRTPYGKMQWKKNKRSYVKSMKELWSADIDKNEINKTISMLADIHPEIASSLLNRGISIPKYHTGGLVNYAYGKEIMAMLEGGEVVVPKETVRDIQQNSTINRGVEFSGNINLSFGDKPNVGAYDIQKAIEKGVQEGLKGVQKTSDMMGSRTVIRA